MTQLTGKISFANWTDQMSTSKKKKKNPLLNAAEKLLINKKNKAPAAKFVQAQKRKQKLIEEMLK